MRKRLKKLLSYSLVTAMIAGSIYKMPETVANASETVVEATTGENVASESTTSETISGGWWTAWTKGYELTDTLEFDIEVKGGTNNWNNVVAVFTNSLTTGTMAPATEVGSAYKEYAVIRTDCWGWGGGDNFSVDGNAIGYGITYDTVEVTETTDINGSGAVDKWDDFVAIMQDAHIDATFYKTLNGGISLIYTVTGANGHGFTYEASTTVDTSEGLYVFFVCDTSEVTVTQVVSEEDDETDDSTQDDETTDEVTADGLQYTVESEESVVITGYSGTDEKVDIPSEIDGMSVTGIADKAFSQSAITSITIPDSITSIGIFAFENCVNLKEIIIPDSVMLLSGGIFFGCTNLESVVLPNGLKEIHYSAFYGCSSLKEIDIPDSVSYIGGWAFRDCISLETINIPNTVTAIDYEAFNGCTGLQSIVLPDSITTLGSFLFANCTKLENVTLPKNLETITFGMFSGCALLTSIEIPNNVKVVEYNAFSNCNSLESITFPEGVTTIGNDEWGVFDGSYNLKTVNIPSTVTYIGGFGFCAGLKEVVVAEDNENYKTVDGVLYNKTGDTLILYPSAKEDESFIVPDGVVTIGRGAFGSNFNYLTNITLAESVTTIEDYAFSDCDVLWSITMSDNLISIGNNAFQSCNKLWDVILPDSLQTIGNAAFMYCDNLKEITLPKSVESIGEQALGYSWDGKTSLIIYGYRNSLAETYANDNNILFVYLDDDDDENQTVGDYEYIESSQGAIITKYSGTDTDLVVPGSLNGLSVVRIDESVFSFNTNLKSVVLPDTVTSIGALAFWMCSNMDTIVIPSMEVEFGSNSVGYGYGTEVTDNGFMHYDVKFDNLTIYGYKGSDVENYAVTNGFKFIEIKEASDTDTDVSVEYTEDAIDTSISVVVDKYEKDEDSYKDLKLEEKIADKDIAIEDVKFEVFDITLVDENEKEVQPDDYVTVKLPCPDGFEGDSCKVYHIDDEGKVWDMKAEHKDGYMSFKTKHFSVYLITETELEVEEEPDVVYGDTNGDGKINVMDAVLMKKHIAGFEGLTINLDACDVNKDGRVNVMDAVMVLKYIAGFDVVLGE